MGSGFQDTNVNLPGQLEINAEGMSIGDLSQLQKTAIAGLTAGRDLEIIGGSAQGRTSGVLLALMTALLQNHQRNRPAALFLIPNKEVAWFTYAMAQMLAENTGLSHLLVAVPSMRATNHRITSTYSSQLPAESSDHSEETRCIKTNLASSFSTRHMNCFVTPAVRRTQEIFGTASKMTRLRGPSCLTKQFDARRYLRSDNPTRITAFGTRAQYAGGWLDVSEHPGASRDFLIYHVIRRHREQGKAVAITPRIDPTQILFRKHSTNFSETKFGQLHSTLETTSQNVSAPQKLLTEVTLTFSSPAELRARDSDCTTSTHSYSGSRLGIWVCFLAPSVRWGW